MLGGITFLVGFSLKVSDEWDTMKKQNIRQEQINTDVEKRFVDLKVIDESKADKTQVDFLYSYLNIRKQ